MKRRRQEAPEDDGAPDPEGFERRLAQYLEWLRVNHYSEATVLLRKRRLAHFVRWCVERSLLRPVEVTKAVLERYQAAIFRYRRPKDGQPLSLTSQADYITCLKGFFRWLARSNRIVFNPASELLVPRVAGRLPRHVLTEEEAERVMNVPDVGVAQGVRDRAMLETLYSTGVRRQELVGLRLYDVDWDRGTLRVREGKGRRERVVPIGDRALGWVEKYVAEVRPGLAAEPDEGYLFLARLGGRFDPDSLSHLVRGCMVGAGIGKAGSVHLFRHTAATVMLEHGADIRYIQAMLGHARLETTQIYTQVSIRKLKEVHTATHPARLKAAKGGAGGGEVAAAGGPAGGEAGGKAAGAGGGEAAARSAPSGAPPGAPPGAHNQA